MSAELDKLTEEIREMRDASKAAAVLLRKLGALIKAGAEDPVKMRALAAELDTDANDLSAAILENTPAESTE